MRVHNLLDGLRKQHQFCWNRIVPVTVPTKHLNVAGTSPEQVIRTSPEQHGVYAAHLNIGFLEVAKVASALSPQIANCEADDPHAGGNASPKAHASDGHGQLGPLPICAWVAIPMHVRGNDQSIMRHNGSWLARWRSHDAHGQLMPVAL